MFINDFTDFSFKGRKASELGLCRVINGSRFSLNLLPPIKDQTIAVPGGNGSYLFGTHYQNKQFSISVAYDHLTETNIREIREWLNGEEVGELIFDDRPYVAWNVKLSAAPNFSFIPFTEEKERIYKGEGTINFVVYSAFGNNPKGKKWEEDYSEKDHPNKKEWLPAANLIKKQGYDTLFQEGGLTKIKVYNSGELPTDFKLYFTISANGENSIILNHSSDKSFSKEILLKNSTNNILKLVLNTKTKLIEELDEEGQKTGKIYNDLIIGGDFFKIPMTKGDYYYFSFGTSITPTKIEYGYYYY